MAGDTHDFEYYRERMTGGGRTRDASFCERRRRGISQHRHGPRLSEAAADQRLGVLSANGSPSCKIDAETPIWKQPFWYWITWFNAWPFSVEALSGIFDFNRAPFFQSFMEVRVERSRKRVVFILNGVQGPLQWRDLQIGGEIVPPGAAEDDPVEFIVPMGASYGAASPIGTSVISYRCFERSLLADFVAKVRD